MSGLGLFKRSAAKKARRAEKKAARKKKRAEKRAARGGKSRVGKFLQKVNRYNLATVALRNGFLLALKKNLLKVSQKLRFGYLTDAQALAVGLDPKKIAKVRKVLNEKVVKVFEGMGGKKENLRNAILKGKWNKNPAINGFNGFDEVEGLGVAVESVVAASGAAIAAIIKALKSAKVDKESDLQLEEEAPQEEASEEAPQEETVEGLAGVMLPIMIVAAGAAAYLTYKAGVFGVNAVKIQNNLVIETGIGQLTLTKMVVDVKMKNPTAAKLSIQHPFVKIFTNEEKISLNEPDLSSNIENKTYVIEPHAETSFKIVIPISIMGAGMAILNLAKKEDRKVWIITETTINKVVPYQKKDVVELPTNAAITSLFQGGKR